MREEKAFKVAGIGELLWDILPEGKQLGGAPYNFAFHALQAGFESIVISAVGRDKPGFEILEQVNSVMDSRYIQKNNFPTGSVIVNLDRQGLPAYNIKDNVAWDHIKWEDDLKNLASTLDAICFGSLASRNQESGRTIKSFISELNKDCLKVFDINLRQNYYNEDLIIYLLKYADILKLNAEELTIIASLVGLSGDTKILLRRLLEMFNLEYIAYTKGEEGSVLISREEYSEVEAEKVIVVDTVGAGDSFAAIMVEGILNKKPLPLVHRLASEVSAYVCTRKGATPTFPDYLLNKIKY